jgi:hypothetical protein
MSLAKLTHFFRNVDIRHMQINAQSIGLVRKESKHDTGTTTNIEEAELGWWVGLLNVLLLPFDVVRRPLAKMSRQCD